MKLKKIASLMLAGVMAVSMLTACGEGKTDPEKPGDDTIVVPETGVVAAVNNGQNAHNDVKITFTSDATLDAALASAVKAYGEVSNDANLSNRIKELTNFETNFSMISNYTGMKYDTLVAGDKYAGKRNQPTEKADGMVVTVLGTKVVDSTTRLTEEMAMKQIASDIDSKVAALKTTSYKEDVTAGGEKYCDYSYTGNVSMVKVVKANGTTSYCFAYTITQTTSVKTLAPAKA